MPAAAITGRNILCAAIGFSAALSGACVQPIIGALIAVERPGEANVHGRRPHDWLPLLAQDEQGYANLIRLISAAHLDSDPADGPHLALEDFEGATDGLIALTGGAEGGVARLLAMEQGEAEIGRAHV